MKRRTAGLRRLSFGACAMLCFIFGVARSDGIADGGGDNIRIDAIDTRDSVEGKNVIARGEPITVTVTNLNKLIELVPKRPESEGKPPVLVLFVNHSPLTGLMPVYVDPTSGKIKYELMRTTETAAFWTNVYRDWRWLGPTTEEASIGVGPDAARELARMASDGKKVVFRFVSWIRYWSFLGSCLILAIGLAILWRRHPGVQRIVRDSGVFLQAPDGRIAMAPYSLARCQMAFWFVLVSFSATFIYVVTGDLPTIPNGLIGMMGISSLTTLGGVAVDATTPQTVQRPSRGLWRDILCDASGALALQRVQFATWTVILGAVAIQSLLADLTITDFQTSTLVLIGMSSGTYVGLKVPENK